MGWDTDVLVSDLVFCDLFPSFAVSIPRSGAHDALDKIKRVRPHTCRGVLEFWAHRAGVRLYVRIIAHCVLVRRAAQSRAWLHFRSRQLRPVTMPGAQDDLGHPCNLTSPDYQHSLELAMMIIAFKWGQGLISFHMPVAISDAAAFEQMSIASITENPLKDKILPLGRVLSSLIPRVLDNVALRSVCRDE